MNNTFKLFDYRIDNRKNDSQTLKALTKQDKQNLMQQYYQTVPERQQTPQGLKNFMLRFDQGGVDNKSFMIQIFGMNEMGEKASITVKDFLPYFYVRVGEFWNNNICNTFLSHLRKKIGRYYASSIIGCDLVERKTLYGFDAGKHYKFVVIYF